MTTLSPCHAGDIGDTRDVILGGVADLDALASIEAHVTRGDVTATLAVTVVDSSARQVRIALGTAEDDWLPAVPAVGTWNGQIEAVFNDDSELTWPNNGNGRFLLPVFAEFG